MARKRKYTIYARHHGADFTTQMSDYYSFPKSTRAIYEVRATSIKQAYRLARQEVWADGPGSVGLLKRSLGSEPRGTADPWERAPYLEEANADR